MASNQAQAGGYDCQWVTAPSDELKCLICLCVARDPHQHPGDSENECGKIFCFSCITEHQKNDQNCPNCRQKLTLFKDARGARYIRALKVKCNNLNNGCEWAGELGRLETHLQSCDHALQSCTKECKNNGQIVQVLRKDLQVHLTHKCPRRRYECRHCEEWGEYQERTTSHLQTCPKVKIPCPNTQCVAEICRGDILKHKLNCEYEPLSCKYAEIGCEERPLRKDLKKHEEDDQLHLRVTRDKVLELKKMAELTVRQSISPVIIKVTSFQQEKKDNQSFHSIPFYTSYTGYKMYVSVYANGEGAGKGTHVSVFARLMKGDNDDSLTWPFTGTVIIELLNQLEDKNHHKMTVTFQAEDKYTDRVVNGEIAESGWGYKKYISHNDLDYHELKNCQYLKNDMLVFKVSTESTKPHPAPWLIDPLHATK